MPNLPPLKNLVFHLWIREIYGYTAVKGKIHYIQLNRKLDDIPPELFN